MTICLFDAENVDLLPAKPSLILNDRHRRRERVLQPVTSREPEEGQLSYRHNEPVVAKSTVIASAENDLTSKIGHLETGRGYRALEVVRAFSAASGKAVPYRVAARRPGDVAQSYADPTRAHGLLDWRMQLNIDAMCADTWRMQRCAVENLL